MFNTAARIAEMPAVLNKKCEFVNSEPSAKTAKLEADLKVQSEKLQALKIEYESQIEHHNEVKAQLKETVDAQIAHLSNELQAKTAEVNEKDEKIKR